MFADGMSIYYLFINPKCNNPVNDLKDSFFSAIPRTSGTRLFCMPSYPEIFLTEYDDDVSVTKYTVYKSYFVCINSSTWLL